jgi:hypothetical protein
MSVWNSESSGMYCRVLNITSVDVQLRTWQYIPEDSELRTYLICNKKTGKDSSVTTNVFHFIKEITTFSAVTTFKHAYVN